MVWIKPGEPTTEERLGLVNDGLILATCMAGLMLIALALTGAGSWIRYIPDPVIVGFTTGIAVIIASGEVADFFGLKVKAPAELVGKAQALWGARATFQWQALALGLAAMALILVLRRFRPKWPGLLIAAGLASLAAALLHLPAETIGDRFGSISGGLPLPHLPRFDYDKIRAVLPSAFTIAFLAAIESLLSATVADSMTGGRHKPNAELMGQGLANLASGLFGGLPATGAIARTATNIRAGGRSPVAGMMHAVFVLIFMLVAGRLMAFAPMTALAAILLLVAWNMAELPRFVALAKGPMGDRVILILTFLLTIFADLTMAIAVGVVLASLRFMHRMAQTVHVDSGEEIDQREGLPPGVEVFAFDGPLFFGAASMLDEALGNTGTRPVAVILRLEHCPMIDATAGRLLADFIARLLADGSRVILCGLHDAKALGGVVGKAETAANFEAAKALL